MKIEHILAIEQLQGVTLYICSALDAPLYFVVTDAPLSAGEPDESATVLYTHDGIECATAPKVYAHALRALRGLSS